MAVKKDTTEKAVKKPAAKKTVSIKAEKKTKETYFYGLGRRKTSVAQVRLFFDDKATESDLIINGKKLKDYFPTVSQQNNFLTPLKTAGLYGKMRMTVLVKGGGVTGQVEAVRLGIARAIVKYDEQFKKALKDLKLLTRDAREVERKKPGLKKARRAPQWAKR
ncbi:MAG TPA: 30S ribosomal protein S9 [Patescibacteria group bacterium]